MAAGLGMNPQQQHHAAHNNPTGNLAGMGSGAGLLSAAAAAAAAGLGLNMASPPGQMGGGGVASLQQHMHGLMGGLGGMGLGTPQQQQAAAMHMQQQVQQQVCKKILSEKNSF